MKRAVYAKTDRFHTEYLMNIQKPHLFRFLFQSGFAVENSLLEMIDSEELKPVLSAMQEAMGMNMEQTKAVFLTIALFAHGYASIIANNSLECDEKIVAAHLEQAYRGAVLAVQKETKGEPMKKRNAIKRWL